MVAVVTSLSRNGVFDWIIQRATAIVLLLYFVFICGYLLSHPHLTYAEWKALFESTSMRIFSITALVSFWLHAWIGMWAISVDYLTVRLLGDKGTVLRMIFQVICALLNFAYLIWGVQILWSL